MNSVKLLFLFFFAILGCLSTVKAEQDFRYFSIISENDIYVPKGQDRHYSNGLRFSVGLDNNKDRPWQQLMDKFPALVGSSNKSIHEFAIGHNLYTPEFYLSPELQADDRPYAGWLYGELSSTNYMPGIAESIAINIGIVGPAALGEQIQKLHHSIIGDPKPLGWEFQLKNEPAILIRYRRSWFTPLVSENSLNIDLITRAGINLGNVFTDAGAGLVLRIGNYLPERELPLRIQPGLSGHNTIIPVRKNMFDWIIFAELQGRGIAHNIFLDGNIFTDSYSVDKRHFVWDAATGLILGFGQFKYPVYFSFSFVWRDREFKLQQGRDSFGSALIGIQY